MRYQFFYRLRAFAIFVVVALLLGCGLPAQEPSDLENRPEVLQKPMMEMSKKVSETQGATENVHIPSNQNENLTEESNLPEASLKSSDRAVSEQGSEDGIALPNLAQLLSKLSKAGEGEKQEAVFALWVFSADHGLSEDAALALDFATYDGDPEVAKTAKQALEDLLSLEEGVQSAEDQEGLQSETAAAEEAEEELKTLATQALWNPLPEKRAEAINVLSLHQSDAMVDVMVKAAQDADVEIRLQALQTLWIAAADGLDHDHYITEALLSAHTDSDPRISEFAEIALEDLDQLKVRAHDEQSFFQPEPFDHSQNETGLEADSLSPGQDIETPDIF